MLLLVFVSFPGLSGSLDVEIADDY
jgi:hypothetical protein